MFLFEAQESYEELNQRFTELEKDIHNKKAIETIFRIIHTLKGNAMGLGLNDIAELTHVIEDVFNEIKSNRIVLDLQLFQIIFRANDILGQLILAIKSGESVKFKGIKTRLEVALRNAKSEIQSPENQIVQSENLENKTVENAEENTILEPENDLLDYKLLLSDTVQVPIRKLDSLMNIIGELIIEKDTLIAKNLEKGFSATEFSRLHRITSDLQYGIMDVRLIQVGFLFNKFHRILRDVATYENKKVELILEGTEIEIDRNILKIMSDSLIHLIRNSVSHGIETPEMRKKAGKSETGIVKLMARNEKDTVFIEIEDDGAGIDLERIKNKAIKEGIISAEHSKMMDENEILMCIFESGFSNADKITEISGRGVGLDVVKKAVESIGGTINIKTTLGKGTLFQLCLPSSMSVKGALLFELDNQEYAIPLSYTEAVISIKKNEIHKINNSLVSKYLNKTISVIFLKDIFEMKSLKDISTPQILHKTFDSLSDLAKLDIIIVNSNNKWVGLVVDKLYQQKEIVEKALANPVSNNEIFSGATILGNGNVCLVLNVTSILNAFFNEKKVF